MHPAASNFRSPLAGSAWAFVRLPHDNSPRIFASDWSAIVRRFQRRAKALLPPFYKWDAHIGACPDQTQTVLAFDPNARRTEDLVVDGIWGPATTDALGALLCIAQQRAEAQRLMLFVRANTNDPMPPETVRAVIWLAFFVAQLPATPAELAIQASIQFPANTTFPRLKDARSAPSADADADWFAIFRPGADPQPLPPSMQPRDTTHDPVPAVQAAKSDMTWLALIGIGAAGLIAYKIATSDTRSNPEPSGTLRLPAGASRSASAQAARVYEALHGIPPRRIVREKLQQPKYLVDLGEMPQVDYHKRLYEGGKIVFPHYRHEFESHARPILAHDERGRLHIVQGHYTTTAHGVEDLPRTKRKKR